MSPIQREVEAWRPKADKMQMKVHIEKWKYSLTDIGEKSMLEITNGKAAEVYKKKNLIQNNK